MRYVNGILCLVMLLFAGVQYNDPDFFIWIPAYLVPAVWAGLAAWRPALVGRPRPFAGLAACLGAAAFATVLLWPTEPGWWQKDVWWEKEVVREGMGVMVLTLVLAVVALTAWTKRRRPA